MKSISKCSEQIAGIINAIREMSRNTSAATEEQVTNAQQDSKAVESVNDLLPGELTRADFARRRHYVLLEECTNGHPVHVP